MIRSTVFFRTALTLTIGLGAIAPHAHAQWPQPRLTSLSRTGLRAGEAVEVTVRGTDLDGARSLWFDHPGLTAIHLKDLTFRVEAAPDVPVGIHDIRVIGTYGVTNSRAFVVGDRPEAVEAEPNHAPERATAVRINSLVNGELNGAADVDYLAFDGRQGQRVFLDLEAERIDSRLDAVIRLIDPDGTEIAESRDVFGVDPFLDVTLPRPGRYLIKIHDTIYAGSPDHFYRLTIHDGPHVDAIMPLAAPAGSETGFVLFGRGLGPGAKIEASRKADGHPLESVLRPLIPGVDVDAIPETSAASRMFVPSAAATGHRGVEYAFTKLNAAGASPVMSRRLLIGQSVSTVIIEQEPNNDNGKPQLVTLPCDISGAFDSAGDVDLYRFSARKGDVWWVEAFAERIGSPADPAILIERPGAPGQPAQDLAAGDDLPDSGFGARFNTQTVDTAIRWQVPDDGLYQVMISDLYGSQRGHPRLIYRLVVRREQPDFALVLLPNSATAAEAVAVRAGGRTSAYVGVIRKDGFGGPIRIEARGLPAGVLAEPITIAANQVLAPIVFHAADGAKAVVATAAIVGSSRFGDRKDDVDYTRGVSTIGPELVHEAIAGEMTWPPSGSAPAVAPARVTRGFVMAVLSEPAPLVLVASTADRAVAQGHKLDVSLDVTRRGGFSEAVVVTATDLPPNMPAASVTIAKEAKTGLLPLFVPRTVPAGIYTFAVRGTGPFPFSKDPNVKAKPNINITEPANAIRLLVRPAPLVVNVDNKGGAIKQGGSLEIVVTIVRQNGFAGSVSLALLAPASSKLSGESIALAANQTQGKLVVKSAKDGALGAVPSTYIRATVTASGESIDVDEPVTLNINK